jgi:hypothetical protein
MHLKETTLLYKFKFMLVLPIRKSKKTEFMAMRKLCFLILLLPFGISAQSDYLVNNRGDTVRGTIRFQMVANLEHVSVKGLKKENYLATAVRRVCFRGVHYKPVQFSGTIKFMQIITDGYLSLLAFQPQGVMNYDGRLLQKRDGKMMEVPTLTFKRQMAAFVQDYAGLAQRIEDGEFSRNELGKIISEYNEFISSKTGTVETKANPIDPEVATQNQISPPDEKQKTKMNLLTDLKTEIQKTEMESKGDVLDMVVSVEERIKENKTVPNYLLQGLSERLANQAALKKKLELLVEAIK